MMEKPYQLGDSEEMPTDNDGGAPPLKCDKESDQEHNALPKHKADLEAGAHSGAKRKKPLSFYFAFLSLVILVLIVSLDVTALAVAIPILTEELNGTTIEAFWASLSFMLAVVVTQPLFTSASDVIGRKPLLYGACILFFIGSIIFAVAKSMTIVILGRLIQGLGGGGLDVLTEILICDITTLKERPFWIGLLSIPMAAGCILGPVLGALFSEYVSWQWIGWINLPLVAICVGCAFFFMRLKPMDEPLRLRVRKLDWLGMGLFTLGCTAFSLPLSWAGSVFEWSSWRTIVPLTIGLVVLIVFAIYERRPSEPVIPYRLFRNRTSVAVIIGAFIHGVVLYPSLFYLPLFFQAVRLQTALRSAISILPLVCILISASFISSLLVGYARRYKWQLWVSWTTTAVGTGLFSLWGPTATLAETASYQVIGAIGLGIQFVVPSVAIQASASRVEDQGLAVGLMVSFRLFGGLVGLAAAATAFSSVFSNAIASLDSVPSVIATLKPADAVGFIPELIGLNITDGAMRDVQGAYNEAFKTIWYIMAAFSSVGLLSSLFVQDLSIETDEVGRQHIEG